jgi:hypothetical protein
MTDPWEKLIRQIHAAPQQAVIVVTGGGASAISDLLSVPGGSRTLLEAVVPYSAAALADWLGKTPEHFCVEETALAMAAVAFERAGRLGRTVDAAQPQAGHEGRSSLANATTDPLAPSTIDVHDSLAVSRRHDVNLRDSLMGLACTASLVSDRPKKGDHRCHIAIQTGNETSSWSLVLAKGARNRAGEEQLVGQLILHALACAAGLDDLPALDLIAGETIVEHHAAADPLLIELLAGRRSVVWSVPSPGNGSNAKSEMHDASAAIPIRGDQFSSNRCPPPARQSEIRNPKSEISGGLNLSPNLATFAPPKGLLCGSFRPLHFGHEQLRTAAERRLGGPVYYEMSIRNVDKPPLDFLSIERRRAQFTNLPLALTAAPTFAEKAAALPETVFVMGVDTAERIVDPRYYQGSHAAMRAALSQVRQAGCRFLVAGRKVGERFETLAEVAVPAEFADLFEPMSPDDFRADVSSTELRRANA